GIRPYGFVIPSGDSSFLNHIFIHGHRFASSSAFSGSGVGAEWRIDNINTADLDDLKMVREFYMGAGASTMNANFDTTAAKADSTSQYWRHEGMHSVGNDNFWGISTEYTHFRTYMEHIEDNYGKDGDDSVWVAGKQEVYEYLSVRESAAVSCVQNSAQATVTIDTSAVSGSLRRYALTLKVEADAAIADVSVNGSTNYSYNSGSGTQLINLQWGSYQYDHFPVSSSGDTGDTGNTGSSADTGDSGSTAADPDNNNITVYPNPARRGQDIAFYDHGWTTALSVKIYSVSGKLIWSGTTEQSWNQENIFHVQVNPGVYTYTVTYPGGYSYKGKLLITE
ncbi:MAG TPA: T9SS type A sorting domain-containing protein, partial [Spirochaetota bacterium]|nr:T9SS type A sorting domain-containing protein [Spirochaetota bacterium]